MVEIEKCERCDVHGKITEGWFCRCPFGREKRRRMMDRLVGTFDRAGLPSRFKDFTLTRSRELFEGDTSKLEALRLATEFLTTGRIVDDWGIQRWGFFLHGENGIGKTGLLAALYNNLCARGAAPLWIKYSDLIRDIQSAYGTDAADARILAAQRVSILFLDDVGDPFAKRDQFDETNDRRRIFFDILSHRHERQLPLFLSANFEDLDQLADQFDTRIADRVMELCAVVEMKGRNLRMPPAGEDAP